jgi:hypothetical protein
VQPAESATTLRLESRKVLLTDGPFVDSKEFLAGVILIEVRPVLEQELGSA